MGLTGTVCATCGVVVAQTKLGRWVHADGLDENVVEHDVDTVIDRNTYLFGEQTRRAEARIPQEYSLEFQERQAIALENIAASLERIAHRLDT